MLAATGTTLFSVDAAAGSSGPHGGTLSRLSSFKEDWRGPQNTLSQLLASKPNTGWALREQSAQESHGLWPPLSHRLQWVHCRPWLPVRPVLWEKTEDFKVIKHYCSIHCTFPLMELQLLSKCIFGCLATNVTEFHFSYILSMLYFHLGRGTALPWNSMTGLLQYLSECNEKSLYLPFKLAKLIFLEWHLARNT